MAQYSTGELAKLTGVTVRTVQYYDEKGLLKPSDLTDGGRRLYSEADLTTLRAILLLKDLGFSLKDIHVCLSANGFSPILALLMDQQESELKARIKEDTDKIERIKELREQLKHMNSINTDSLGAIATIMGNRKKLRRMHFTMIGIGLIMDAAWIGTLIYAIISGIWWPFVLGLLFAIIMGIGISVYYFSHVAYVCPEDGTIFRPSIVKMFFSKHTPSTRTLICPTCHQKEVCLEIYAPDAPSCKDGKTTIWNQCEDNN